VPLEDVQRLAGHADPRTTRLYDRRQNKINPQHRRADFDLSSAALGEAKRWLYLAGLLKEKLRLSSPCGRNLIWDSIRTDDRYTAS
jgi:hypothetical protein